MKKQVLSVLAVLSILTVGIILTSFVIGENGGDGTSGDGDYLIVRTIEPGGMWPSEIIVVYEDGKIETFELKKFKGNNFVENVATIQSKLNDIKNKGYNLISSNGGNSDNMVVNTYVFQKK
jgi:hypothetical protein